MAVTILRQLRNTRDLRAQILSLAADLANNTLRGSLQVIDPRISEATIREEWARLLPVIVPEVGNRMTLLVESGKRIPSKSSAFQIDSDVVMLDRPNYRYEVLRLLIGANLQNDGPETRQGLMENIGASQTPISQALRELKQAGVARSWGRGLEVEAEDVSSDLIAKIHAQPQTLRFRFERGAQIKPPAALLQRVLPLLHPGAPAGWEKMALSGTPVALADVPKLDLLGTPRLDLVAHVPRDAKAFDSNILRVLDDGLELEPNVLAPAPVVVTLVRAKAKFTRDAGLDQAWCAYPMDVFLSLLDAGLREQALQYAKVVRH
jgi:hypothetical protein